MLRSNVLPAALAGMALTVGASPALAAKPPNELPAVKRTLTAASAADRDCTTRSTARSTDTTAYTAPMSGFVTVRSAGSRRGDWDLAVFDVATRRKLGSSQAFRSAEVVQTWVGAGQRLEIQGCRRSGRATSLPVSVHFADVAPPKDLGKPVLAQVKYRDNRDLQRIEQSGLDLTHHIHGGKADVIATGADGMSALRSLGLPFEIEIADLAKHYTDSRKADVAYSRAVGESPLPSGRTQYRTYEDIQAELKQLAEDNPGLVKPVTLPHKTLQGREVTGLEFAKDVDRKDDGRPTYFVVSTHHAREWPSAEASMELAHLLAKEYGSNARITDLLTKERIVIVPLINPDGYVESRGFPASPYDQTGATDPFGVNPIYTAEVVGVYGGFGAYRRKNCNGAIPSGNVPCTLQYGVDPNRNYGEGWGGPGAGSDPITQSYRGPDMWSEPETKNVHEFSQSRPITNIVSIHTVAALVLRPPGRGTDGLAPDEQRMKEIGDRMADAAGYKSQYSFELYDTSGTTEDWNYAAAGSYGYTIEMGPEGGEFHMPYETGVVNEWLGKPGTAAEGRGLKEALLIGAEAAANAADHSVLTGTAQPGRTLRLRKEFETKSSKICTYAQGYVRAGTVPPADCVAPGGQRSQDDFLDYTTQVPASGAFTWHVTPSTRPFVGQKYVPGEKTPVAEPMTFTPTAEENKLVEGAVDEEAGSVEREFTVSQAADEMVVDLTWAAAPQDYDLKLYRVGADGSRTEVDSSANAPGSFEQITVADPAPGTYVLRVVYYVTAANDWTAKVSLLDQQADRVDSTGRTESWTLTCEDAEGKVLGSRQVTVARGETLALGTAPGCAPAAKKPKKPKKG